MAKYRIKKLLYHILRLFSSGKPGVRVIFLMKFWQQFTAYLMFFINFNVN